MITPRVAALRQQSLDAIPTISAERAVLMTAAYRLHDGLLSAPMRRGLILRPAMIGSERSAQICENGRSFTLPSDTCRQNWSGWTEPSQETQPMPLPVLLPWFIWSSCRTSNASSFRSAAAGSWPAWRAP
jgi:hypothetical protein